MSAPVVGAVLPVSDAELVEALQRSLRETLPGDAEVVRLGRRPSEYRTSFALEEVDARLSDGTLLRLMLKDVRPQALDRAARDAKPVFLRSPRREVAFYRRVPAADRPGTARVYAAVADESRGQYWLLLERVPGVELYQSGDLATWKEAARWLARFHARLAASPARLAALADEVGLIRYDAAFYRTWMRRARSILPARRRALLDRLAERYDGVVERLLELPPTLLHGEFYASNVVVEERPERPPRVCPIDWEMAALGPGLVDLAALTAGGWTEEERSAIVRAYQDAWTALAPSPLPAECFRLGLAGCRLHVAVQWLGWSARWSPPREHAQDWLGTALELAEQLSL